MSTASVRGERKGGGRCGAMELWALASGRLLLEVAYKFWAKVRAMDGSRYEWVALEAAWRLHIGHSIGWVHDMVGVFLRVGFVRTWAEGAELRAWGADKILAEMSRFLELSERFAQEALRARVWGVRSKYNFLTLVHPNFGAADVCTVSWPWSLRRALLKFMLSDHNLGVETGRYATPQLRHGERFCLACEKQGVQAVDDELHALDVCFGVASSRATFWESVCNGHVPEEWRGRSVVKLLTALGSFELRSRRQVWHALAVFVSDILNARSSFRQSEDRQSLTAERRNRAPIHPA